MYATQTSTTDAQRHTGAVRQTAQQEQHISYEIFRRAIVQRDGDAWLEISARYRPLLISWAIQCSASGSSDEQDDDIADRALARAWSALTPERFDQFPNIAALLAYLRTCVTATAIDSARSQVIRDRALGKLDIEGIATPEEVVLDQLERDELWQAAAEAAGCEHERVVLVESFLFELPPRAILARHPNLFAKIDEVYLTKRHLLGRLQRSPSFRRFMPA